MSHQGIWEFLPEDRDTIKYTFSANEGNTPFISVTGELLGLESVEKINLKLENLNPFGSFKDRSMAYLLSKYYSEGNRNFSISSSGNAGISAIGYTQIINNQFPKDKVKLDIFVSSNLPNSKQERIDEVLNDRENITVNKSLRPKSDCIKFANVNNSINLRQSADPNATIGYKTIVYENTENLKGIDSIFICCSSGTSTVGIAKALSAKNLHIPIHIVQSTKIHPIASLLDTSFETTKTSLSSAVSDRVAKRKEEVVSIIKETKGFGWVVNDEEIQDGITRLSKLDELQKFNFKEFSPEMGLVYGGLVKAIKSGREFNSPLLILSGY